MHPQRTWPKRSAHHHELCNADASWRNLTLGDFARRRAEVTPDRVVFPGLSSKHTYASLLADAEALAAAIGGLGLQPGDVISFQTPNWVEAAVINLAAALGGYVINPIVIIYRDAEVELMLADSRSRLLFTAEAFRGYDFRAMAERMRPRLPDLNHVFYVRGDGDTSYDALLQSGRGRPAANIAVDANWIKLLLYTSGTTGRPKGVLHSHNTITAVVEGMARHWGIQENDCVLTPSPITHITGYCNGLESPFVAGTRTVLMESWNAEEAMKLIDEHQVAATLAATPFLQELATAVAKRAASRLPSLKVFPCGGAPVPPNLVRQANAAFAQPCAFRMFGSSETPLVTVGYQGAANAELAAVTDGAIGDYQVKIVDEAGASVEPGVDGEILVRGPAMFVGYADSSQTADALTEDGYFRTGDIGHLLPEGALLITGRKKDLIIRGGENISAKEIEDVLHRHPQVAEAAVVAMPHARLGEGVMAFIVPRADKGVVDVAAIASFVSASGLSKQKIPERFAVVGDFPRTPSGKIRKDKLREEARRIVGEAGQA